MTLVSDLDLPAFDYTAPDFSADRYHQQLAETSQQGWLAKSPLAYMVLDHDSGEYFLRSRATAFPGRQIAEFFGVTGGPLADHIDANILNLTGEQHRRLRALVGPAFTPRRADRWRPVMRGFLEQLWSEVADSTGCDFVAAVARPYPSLTIATVLGAPHQDAGRLQEWSSWVQRQFDIRALGSNRGDIERAVIEVQDYVAALLEDRRAAPADDLISDLLAARDEEGGAAGRLSAAECVQLVVNVLAGGIDTTSAQLAHAIRLFAGHPAQWALLAGDPGLAPRAVDEVLRFEPVTPFTARICLEQVEHRGVIFPAGTIVAVCAERANREAHADEEFDIRAARDARLLTFGAGTHYCLGANLARAELEEALAFLAPRTPDLALDGPPQLGGVEGIYGIDKLPITWSGPT
ncbi:MAG TPA: cytochrome P450 [Streptosporangiaceae bacterium]|nr:cytochrome P450 [Streptosporangiaceae bacterium]HLN67619.1 cytochrome P450 [Streptosporangiaceae bacterium]